MSRDARAIMDELMTQLPPGWVWPRDRSSNLARLLQPFAAALANFEAGAERLMAETDPRLSYALLPDFERVLGPDPCGRDDLELTWQERRAIAHQRWTARGGASPAYFKGLAAALGETITIEEFWPFECGFSRCGDELGGDDGDGEQFVWIVKLGPTRFIEFELGVAQAGDPLGDFRPSLIECVIRRLRPAHTDVVFSYGAPEDTEDP